MTHRIDHQFFYPNPPEKVWVFLTDPSLMSQWLMENDFKPEPGHEFTFRSRPMPELDFDGIIYCKILEITPYKKLTYSWKAGPGDGRITMDSTVFWTLIPKDGGTELILEHSGFEEMSDLTIFHKMNAGWATNMRKIAGLLETK